MSRWHADNYRHLGHYPEDHYTSHWSPKGHGQGHGHGHGHGMTDSHPFCSMTISPPIPEIRLFQHFTLKFMVKTMCVVIVKVTLQAQQTIIYCLLVKPDGHIWCLRFNWSVCFLVLWQWDHICVANSIFDLENSRSNYNENQPKCNQVIYWSGPSTLSKWKKSKLLFRSNHVN